MNLSSTVSDPSHAASPEESIEPTTEAATAPVSPQGDAPYDPSGLEWSAKNRGDMTNNNGAREESQSFSNIGDKHSSPEAVIHPGEEEAAFLRSLWREKNAEEEGLTEEEISAFYEKYMKLRPSSKLCRGMQYHVGSLGDASSGLNKLQQRF